MFVDEAKIKVQAGKGGDGIVSFRHERTKPRGGPDGGNGGNGGSIWVAVSPRMTTLSDYRRQKIYKAEAGQDGGKNERRGKSGEDLILYLPLGTVIKFAQVVRGSDPRKFRRTRVRPLQIIDLVDKDEKIKIAQGGKGGHGNAWFKNSVRQAPRIRQLGTKGDIGILELELKLLADIGLIGLPNSGKSTLLSRLTHARPKIADYPFTTLEPNLGVLEFKQFGIKSNKALVIADIPGLIEEAHQGKGLGIRFLRHVERCKILIHIIDATSNDILRDYQTIIRELKNYSSKLAKKPQILVVNKIDAINQKLINLKTDKLKNKFKINVIPISAVTGKGLKELVIKLLK